MLEIDPQFRRMGQGARRRRFRLGLLRGAALIVVLGLMIGTGWHYLGPDIGARLAGHMTAGTRGDDGDESLVPLEQDIAIAPVVRADTFTDIPGDPMIIQTEEGDDTAGAVLQGPLDLATTRVGPPTPERLTIVRENLHVRERRLIAALPTTREEFALFQAERSRERLMNAALTEGDTVSTGASGGLPMSEAERMTSSMAFTRAAAIRPALWQDLILQIRLPTELTDLLRDNGFDAATAARTATQITEVMQIDPELPRGSLLALRYRMQAGQRQVLQLSLYRSGAYVGSMAMSGSGRLVSSADPWADQTLLDQSADETVEGDSPQFRLLDVIYSAALRQGVPGDVIGEGIAMMSKVHDLDGFAAEGDRLQLLFANTPGAGAQGAGQILFIGVTGPSGDKPCYVVPAREGGYECHAPGARVIALSDQPAMSAPVAGVLSRRFVAPVRGDADSGTVAWQAAQGSPVAAIAAGRVTEVDARAGTVSIAHDGGLSSSYRGLENPPASLVRGADVKRGAVIGRVAGKGQDARSGLTFQLLKDGQPVDPIPYLTGGNEVLASNAVEALISRIIHVESAGNATARNPLSTATGLGQFIESTWLRMMRSYRPDLVASLDRQQLLDLRLEPGLSRQMVRHLAQENEAFLRARGIQATAGNLYLAHFLGPMGATQALSADPSVSVGSVMGAGVVNANPFLRNYTIADLRAWSDRKMNAQSVAAATSMPAAEMAPVSPEVRKFVALMDGILSAPQN